MQHLNSENQRLTTETEALRAHVLQLEENIKQLGEQLAREKVPHCLQRFETIHNSSARETSRGLEWQGDEGWFRGMTGWLPALNERRAHELSMVQEQMVEGADQAAKLQADLSSQKVSMYSLVVCADIFEQSMSELCEGKLGEAIAEVNKLKSERKIRLLRRTKELWKVEKWNDRIVIWFKYFATRKALEGNYQDSESGILRHLTAQMGSTKTAYDQTLTEYESAKVELETLKSMLEQKDYLNCNLSVECENKRQTIREMEIKIEHLIRENTRRVKESQQLASDMDMVSKSQVQLQALVESLRTENSRLIVRLASSVRMPLTACRLTGRKRQPVGTIPHRKSASGRRD
eukprot:759683-Hanusia_phi.AAC.6